MKGPVTLSVLLVLQIWCMPITLAQLKPGFNKAEYAELIKVSMRSTASPVYFDTLPAPENFRMLYQSPVIGLENLWDLWIDKTNQIAAISIRGTTQNSVSWLANFYAAMVPAKGTMRLSDSETFDYTLSEHPQAAVHVGWLVSLAFLTKDILPKMDSLNKQGIRDFVIVGHSQGGAIAFLLTAYLHHLKIAGRLPADMRLKTYCSAGPKPGNLYFAYSYETLTRGGWAYNVVNSADWVPEVPFSIQTVNDFNATNPFVNVDAVIKAQKFPKNIALRHLYNKLDKPTRRAQKNYEKYLGKMTSTLIQKSLPEYQSPEYYHSNNYVRTGTTIVLMADEAYFKRFPESKENIFIHHLHMPYLYLLEKYPD